MESDTGYRSRTCPGTVPYQIARHGGRGPVLLTVVESKLELVVAP